MIDLDAEEGWCLFCEIKEWGAIGGIFWFVRNQGRFYGFLVRNVFKIRLLRRFLSKMYISLVSHFLIPVLCTYKRASLACAARLADTVSAGGARKYVMTA